AEVGADRAHAYANVRHDDGCGERGEHLLERSEPTARGAIRLWARLHREIDRAPQALARRAIRDVDARELGARRPRSRERPAGIGAGRQPTVAEHDDERALRARHAALDQRPRGFETRRAAELPLERAGEQAE